MSKIEWCDETWNPVVGCSKISPGCDHCYALRMARRLAGNPKTPWYKGTIDPATSEWSGKVVTAPESVWEKVLAWKKPKRIFVGSMSDIFYDEKPGDCLFVLADIRKEARGNPQHTFILLTKRPAIARQCLGNVEILPNVHLGVTVENADYLYRIDTLRETLAALRFVSFEPLLGPIDDLNLDGIGHVIVGGETGPRARPMHPDWVRKIRDDCVAAGVPFFMKQMSGKAPIPEDLNIKEIPND